MNVDTSLDGGDVLGRDKGLDLAAGTPDVSSDALLQPVSQSDFTSAMQSSDTPVTFTDTGANLAAPGGARGRAEAFAKQFLGTPYVWGGANPGGFDCSGLVQYVWKKFGLSLPRVSQQQAHSGQVTSLNSLKPMDLVLFNEGGNDGPGHVAFWLGNGMILEAPHTGAQVRIRHLGKGENVFGVHLDIKD